MNNSLWRWTKRGLLVLFGWATVSAGASAMTVGEGSLAVFLSGYVASFALLWWCWIDSRLRGTPIPHGAVLVFLFTGPVVPMVYVIWSRGLMGLGIVLLTMMAFFALFAAGEMLGYLMFA